ncbi:MAG: hypothetical protein MJY58_02425 [Bacteroidaceae bacterium]|nr:hypothetical protein [Bacteroidaceae bacterium]
MKPIRYLISFLILLAACPVSAQNLVSVEARVDSVMLWVGEQTACHLEVSCDRGCNVDFPLFTDTIVSGLEIIPPVLTDTQYVNDGNRMVITRHYTVTCFDSALVFIPPIAVGVDGQEYLSNSMAVSFLVYDIPQGQEKEIFPPKHNMGIPLAFNEIAWPLLHLILLAAALFLAVFCYRRYNDNKPIIKKIRREPKVPAHIRATQAIENLRQNGSAHSQNPKEYYTALTDILRVYMNERFGFNATEMTSGEILENLQNSTDKAAIDELAGLLSTADMVKFAKSVPLLGENDRNLFSAMEFVKSTTVQETADSEPQIIEDTVVIEKRSKEARIALLVAFVVCVVAALTFTYFLVSKLYYLFF